jgi:hypothetical protein
MKSLTTTFLMLGCFTLQAQTVKEQDSTSSVRSVPQVVAKKDTTVLRKVWQHQQANKNKAETATMPISQQPIRKEEK